MNKLSMNSLQNETSSRTQYSRGSQVDRKATERVYAGGKDTERVEDGPDSADMEEERGCA